MKCFSLIDKNKKIEIAPGKKVISGKELSTLLSAKEVVETAEKEAEEYRLKIEKEGEELKEKAKEDGFNDGLQKWTDEIAKFDEELKKHCSEMEKVIVPLALKAAKKIVSREIELNRETVVDIVANSLRIVAHHRNVTIYVSKSDLGVLEQNRPRLKQVLEVVESLSVQEREDVEPGGCIIETEGGIINAQLENLWRALERSFQSLMKAM